MKDSGRPYGSRVHTSFWPDPLQMLHLLFDFIASYLFTELKCSFVTVEVDVHSTIIAFGETVLHNECAVGHEVRNGDADGGAEWNGTRCGYGHPFNRGFAGCGDAYCGLAATKGAATIGGEDYVGHSVVVISFV